MVRIWSDRSLCGGGVEATFACFRNHRFSPHTHDCLMLGLIEAGTKAFARDRVTWIAPAGAISIVNPGEMHTGYRIDGDALRYRAIYLPLNVLAEAVGSTCPDSINPSVDFRSGVVIDPALFADLVAAHDAILSGDTRLAREHQLLAALAGLARRHGSRPAPPQSHAASAWQEVIRVRQIIDQRFQEELAIADLAGAVGLSSFYLMRRFRRQIGLPIHAYQIQRRIERAKQLLRTGQPIVEIALQLGFADQAHFTKRFKALVGAPPAVYRRDVRR